MIETALSLPFKLDAYGKFTSTNNQAKIWGDRVRIVIGTNLRERIMRPEFGTLVPSAFMETQETANSMITTEINRAFATQLTKLKLFSVDTSFDEFTNIMQVTVVYDLPNDERVDTVVSLIFIDGNNPPYEENL